VLASRSPQRRAILAQLGIPFRVVEPLFDETPLELSPAGVVEARARGKARSVAPAPEDGPVLGVDTEVTLDDGSVLGKPGTSTEATAMLRALAGRTHLVLSGLCVRRGTEERVGHAVTAVTFRPLTADAVEAYVGLDEWRGRAGGYAIQGVGAALVERVDGCYPNVVGLPVALLARELEALGVPFLAVAAAARGARA
jgi:septum formation protein